MCALQELFPLIILVKIVVNCVEEDEQYNDKYKYDTSLVQNMAHKKGNPVHHSAIKM